MDLISTLTQEGGADPDLQLQYILGWGSILAGALAFIAGWLSAVAKPRKGSALSILTLGITGILLIIIGAHVLKNGLTYL